MKLFKKKYERSAWFEGLLWAENLKVNRGWSDDLIYSRAKGAYKMTHGPSSSWVLPSTHFFKGVFGII